MLIYIRVQNNSSKSKLKSLRCLKMGSLEELREMTMPQLVRKLDEPDEIFKTWLEDAGLLKSQIICPNCQNNMTPCGRLFKCHRMACRDGNSRPTCSQFSGWLFIVFTFVSLKQEFFWEFTSFTNLCYLFHSKQELFLSVPIYHKRIFSC